jgi:hypothetical protein
VIRSSLANFPIFRSILIGHPSPGGTRWAAPRAPAWRPGIPRCDPAVIPSHSPGVRAPAPSGLGSAGVRFGLYRQAGGEGGIRTPGTGFNPVQQISNLPCSATPAPVRERLIGAPGCCGDHLATTGGRLRRVPHRHLQHRMPLDPAPIRPSRRLRLSHACKNGAPLRLPLRGGSMPSPSAGSPKAHLRPTATAAAGNPKSKGPLLFPNT